MATDLAEFVGAAVGLNLLFHVPLAVAGLMTAVVAFGILALEQRGYRRFELAITALLGHRVLRVRLRPAGRGRRPGRHRAGPDPEPRQRKPAARRRHHRGDGHAARRLPALGADEVARSLPRRRRAPGAAALPAPRRADRARRRRPGQPDHAVRRGLAVPPHRGGGTSDSIEAAHAGLGRLVGGGAALAFAVALLASGLSSSSVGTYAGPGRHAGLHRPPHPAVRPPRGHHAARRWWCSGWACRSRPAW